MTVTGPNDAGHVVWALGMCFLFCSCLSFLTCFSFFIDVFLMIGRPLHLQILGTGPK